MPHRPVPTPSWSQDPLIPVYWPIVDLTVSWALTGDSTPSMVSYDVHGWSGKATLLAGGIEWLKNHQDPSQVAEIQHDLIKIALGHLWPF